MSKEADRRNYVLVVDYKGETDIFQLSYDTTWDNVAVLLQVKYDCKEMPGFTYLDDDDESIVLDSQEAFSEAHKISRKNDDVLHVELHPKTELSSFRSNTQLIPQSTDTRPSVRGSILWASNAVKQAVQELGQGLISMTTPDTSINMDEVATTEETQEVNSAAATNSQIVTVPTQGYCEASTSRISDVAVDEESHEEYVASAATSVKRPVAELDEISVPTSLYESDSDEMSVKMPIAPSPSRAPEPAEKEERNPDMDIRTTIQQEIRSVLNEEMNTLREEINSRLLLHVKKERRKPADLDTSDDSFMEPARSPKAIKRDIQELRREMKVSKMQKRRRKYNTPSGDDASRDVTDDKLVQARRYAASFICENLLDGSKVGVGQSFTKYWVLKNEGTKHWDHKVTLELLKQTPSPDGSSVDPNVDEQSTSHAGPSSSRWGPNMASVTLPVVNSLETTVIAVTHVAPGHVCNYTSSWRLHRKGQSFGPRVWCTVSVVETEALPTESLEPCSATFTADEGLSFTRGSSQWIAHQTPQEPPQSPTVHNDSLSNMLSFDMENIGEDYTVAQAAAPNPPEAVYSYEELSSADAKTTEAETNTEAPTGEEHVETQSPSQDEDEMEVLVVDDEERDAKEEENVADVEGIEIVKTDDEAQQEEEEEQMLEERDAAEDRLRDEQNLSDSDSTTGDEGSDFEVIPLPECFDTTRPLSGSERDNHSHPGSLVSSGEKSIDVNNEEKHPEAEASHTQQEEEQQQEEEAARSGLTGEEEKENVNLAENVAQVPDAQEAKDDSFVDASEENKTVTIDAENDENVADASQLYAPGTPPNQSTLSDLAVAASAPKPVPQSVLDMDKPFPVLAHSQGYELPAQKAEQTPQPWLSQPIALPRAVLDANEPWNAPTPQPRSREAESRTPHGDATSDVEERQDSLATNSQMEQPLENENTRVSEATSNPARDLNDNQPLNDEDNPHILYPPVLDENVDDEFTLAPEPMTPNAPLAPGVPSSFEQPYNPSPMAQLIEMGFTDIQLNTNVLSEFGGDINRSVQALVFRGEMEDARTARSARPRQQGGNYYMA